jgi:hypothetical protein|tara:strand:- start:657 stop:782 length:126 start_codon:yes stop_codon:yes gene_type:complete
VEEKKCNKHKEINDIELSDVLNLANCAVSSALATKLSDDLK